MAKKDELNFETDNKMASSEKLKALQAAMEKIEKSFGKGSIMKMGDDSVEQVEVIPTGSIALNVALGVGGYPRGRIIEIYGPESSGKTTLAIHAIAEAQKAGGIAAFIDAEHAFDRFYASKLGVNIDDLYISQPDNGEQALEIAEQLIRIELFYVVYTRAFPLTFEEHHGSDHCRNSGGVAHSLHTCFPVSFLMAAIVVYIISTFLAIFQTTDTTTDRGFSFVVFS